MKKLWYAACAAAFCLMLSSCVPNVGKITYSGGFDAPTVFSLSEEAAARVGKDYPIYKPVFPSVYGILSLFVSEIMHFGILPHISVAFLFTLAPSAYSFRTCMIRFAYRLVVRT